MSPKDTQVLYTIHGGKTLCNNILATRIMKSWRWGYCETFITGHKIRVVEKVLCTVHLQEYRLTLSYCLEILLTSGNTDAGCISIDN